MTGPPDCEEAVHRLKSIFGEYCLYNAWFEAVELTTHPTRLTGSLDDTAERATLLLGHYGALAIPAHPIASEPPWLTITRDYLRYVPASTEFYFIAPSTSYAEYWRRMPRKYRHELTRKVARFSERSHGEIDMRIYHSVAEAREFYSRASALARKTYQTRLLDAGLPQTVSFEAELLARAKRGRMRGYLLFQRGMPIAYAYCTVTGDCLRFRNIGYDPAFSGWSPGIVLIYEALRAAIGENRFAILDFGSGEAQSKAGAACARSGR